MLLDIIILVLRETIEAGILLSVLLCVSNQNKVRKNWLWMGLLAGIVGAITYAANFSQVGEWFDYAGQEAVNASMQFGIYLCLIFLCSLLIFSKVGNHKLLGAVFTVAIALAITRELAEMIIFYSGFFQSEGDLVKGSTSGFIGLMIGVSFGVLCYYAINIWSRQVSKKIQIFLISFIAAGLIVQTTQLLIQVDWVSASKPLWNTNWLLKESSTFGQMTYAIFGYESTPTAPEVGLYTATLCFVAALSLAKYFSNFLQPKN